MMKEKYKCKKEQTLYEAILTSATRYPNRVALRYFHKPFTYRHLIRRINQFAFALKGMGVNKDEPVTICLPNTPDAVYLLYAVNQIGAIANIVHPLFTYEQMDENLSMINGKILFCLDTRYDLFKPLIKKGVKIIACSPSGELPLIKRFVYKRRVKDKIKDIPSDDFVSKFYAFPRSLEYDTDFKKDSLYLHSGGTSGKSKTIALSSFSLNALCYNSAWITGFDTFVNKGMMAVLPMFHGFGLCMGIHAYLAHGGYDVLIPKFSRKDTIKYIKRGQLSILIGVPVLYEALLSKRNFRGRKLRSINIAFVGGDYVSPALMERFNIRMEKSGSICRLREGYGLTETVNVCTVNTHFHYKPGTVGKMLPNVIAKVLDEKGNELPFDTEGEICIGGETIMNGYRFSEDKDINKKSFYIDKDGNKYVKTGDFGSVDSDGFITFKTRLKRIVKVNGIPVFPSMIEDAATSFNFVFEVCAIGVEDPKRGHIIKLFVVLSKSYKGTKEEAISKLNERIVSRLGVYSKPKEIIFMDKLPHTPIGKIDYKLLQ